jgi:predicted P-loop ATPase
MDSNIMTSFTNEPPIEVYYNDTQFTPCDDFNDFSVELTKDSTPLESVQNKPNGCVLTTIPQSLKQFNNWVVWKHTERNGKKSKVPYTTNGETAKTNDSSTWCSFEQAINAFQSGQFKFDGIGFVVNANINHQKLIGLDIDHPFDSEISKEIISHFRNSYCEKSPSGKLHIFCTGLIPRSGKGNLDKKVEVYDEKSPRYLTVTGQHIDGTNTNITDCQDALDWLFNRFFSNTLDNQPPLITTPAKTQIDNLSDDQVIELLKKAKNSSKFHSLFNGGGKNDSDGDLALARIIVFYTGSNTGQGIAQLDRIMRLSARANIANGKWDQVHYSDGRTYGQATCQKAIDKQKEFYIPGTNKKEDKNEKTNANPSNTPDINKKEDKSEKTNANPSNTPDTNKKEDGKWHLELAITPDQDGIFTVKGNLYNMLLIIRNDDNLKGLFGFNEFTRKVEKLKASDVVKLSKGELEDNDITHVRNYLSNSLKNLNSHKVAWDSSDVLASIVCIAKECYSFHPVRDYLNSLEWDGSERIDYFFTDYCGTTHDQYTAFLGKSLFISLVARVMQPGCKLDTIPILEGDQGIGKSTVLRSLCPKEEWFKDSGIDLNNIKDAYVGLIGRWIIELAELDALNKAESTRIKSFITSQKDSYRPPYGKCDVDVPRQCGFVGTTNKSNYLKDETGNRRFLPIKCESTDVDAIITVRDQLWAEAVVRYRNGEKWHYGKEDQELFVEITKQQESRYEGDSWEIRIEEFARSHNDFSIADVAHSLLIDLKDIDKRVEMRISKVLDHLGCTKDRKQINGKRRRVYNQLGDSKTEGKIEEEPF